MTPHCVSVPVCVPVPRTACHTVARQDVVVDDDDDGHYDSVDGHDGDGRESLHSLPYCWQDIGKILMMTMMMIFINDTTHTHAYANDALADADVDNEHQSQASSRASVSPKACDRVPPGGQKGS